MIYLGKYHKLTSQVYRDYKKQKNYASLIDDYYSKMESHQKNVFKALINKITYFSYEKLKDELQKLYRLSYLEKNTDAPNTFYLPPILDLKKGSQNNEEAVFDKYHNSKVFFDIFAKHNSEPIFTEKYFMKFINCKEKTTLFVVDDFAGTGNTIIEYTNNLKKYLEKRNKSLQDNVYVVILLLSCMRKAKETLLAENYKVICPKENVFEKAFDEGVIFKNAERRKTVFKSINKNFGIKGDDLFGYNDSQALIGFDHNTPNNTIKLFWANNQYNLAPILLSRNKSFKKNDLSLRRKIENMLTKFLSAQEISEKLNANEKDVIFELSTMKKIGLVKCRRGKYKSVHKNKDFSSEYVISKPRI